MLFKSLLIENFRNFEYVKIGLSNKNVVFGMNDSGKTNLLFAIRFLLDRNVRNKGLIKSDYHQHDTSKPIKIQLELDLSDRKTTDTESKQRPDHSRLLIATVADARKNSNLDSFFITLEANYDEKELFGNPILKWGSTLDHLKEIPQYGTRSDLDKIFQIVYVDPTIDLDSFFKRNKKFLFSSDSKSDTDIELEQLIEKNIQDLNRNISNLDLIKEVQSQLTNAYKNYRNEDLEINIQSEISISGYLDNLTPYINWNGDSQNYPTSGDGRRKLLSYAINQIVSRKQNDNKILIYLIEEPENSLHRSIQISLSQQFFNDQIYDYFFLTTHSAEILYEMDDTQLIKISNKQQAVGKSFYYTVPEDFGNLKKKLNKSLAQSIFYDTICLVEGPSEYFLFSAIIEFVNPTLESTGKYIVQVGGTNFMPYLDLYRGLGMECFVKTDNDLQAISGNKNEFSVIGLNRCLKLVNIYDEHKVCNVQIDSNSEEDKIEKLKAKKRQIYDTRQDLIDELQKNHIYLSEIDLENDLAKTLDDNAERGGKNEADFVHWLQSRKQYNMIDYINNVLDEEIANKIISSQYFKVLSEFIEYE